MPDCNETPADTRKECRQNLNIQQRGPIMPRKYLTRCLFSSNNMKIQALLKEWLKNQPQHIDIALSQTKRKTNRSKSERIRNKYCYTSQSKLKRAWTYMVASATSGRSEWTFDFYNAKHLYMMKTASTRRNMNNTTTPQYDSHMQRRPIQRKPRLKFQVSPLDGTYFANVSSLQKSTTKWYNEATIIYRNYPFTP